MTLIKFSELAKHNTADDLWMEINGNVYDLTKFKSEHPGGSTILIKRAG